MKIVVGLGNPGAEYADTKHNVGFMFIDAFAETCDILQRRESFEADIAETRIGTEKVLLVKPLTFMNDSGRSLGPLLSWYKLSPEDMIVVHDDMDIPVGTVRIRKKGSAGGHNGIRSILSHVGSEDFSRVRIGIGRPPAGWTVVHHVLAPFAEGDAEKIQASIDYLIPAVRCMITDGTDFAMNRYNPRRKKGRQEAKEQEGGKGISKN